MYNMHVFARTEINRSVAILCLKKQTLIAFCPYDCVCVCMNIFFRWIERSFGRSFRNVLHQQHTISHHVSRIRCGVHRFFSRFSFVCLLFFVILFHRVQHTNCKQATTCVHRALSLQYWIHSRNTHIVYEDIFTQFNVFASFRVRYYLVQCVYFFRFLMDFWWLVGYSYLLLATAPLLCCFMCLVFVFGLYLFSSEAVLIIRFFTVYFT